MTEFILCCLAVWRVSHMIAYEAGFGNIFERFRVFINKLCSRKARKRHLEMYEIVPSCDLYYETSEGSLYNGLICVACNSVWFSAILAIFVTSNVLDYIIWVFALSAGAIILEKLFMEKIK